MVASLLQDGNGIFSSMTMGLVLAVLVTAADLADRDGARQLHKRGCGFGQKLLKWVPMTGPRNGGNKVHPDGCGRL